MKMRASKNKNGIIIGMILGDACIEAQGRITIGHGIKQREYLKYKSDLLKNFFSICEYEREIEYKGSVFTQIGIKTNTTPYLKQFRRILYRPKKKITLRLLNKLNPQGLAIWYMDDGSTLFQKDINGNIESRKGYLNTQGFSLEENKIIVKYFKETLNIKVKIHLDKGMCRIYFNSTELKKLVNIIEPYIIPSMKYKICMRYGKSKASENLCKKECSSNCKLKIL